MFSMQFISLKSSNSDISVVVCSFFEFETSQKGVLGYGLRTLTEGLRIHCSNRRKYWQQEFAPFPSATSSIPENCIILGQC